MANTVGLFHCNTNSTGLIISCQNVAYAISKFIGGILSDRLSSRILFGCGLFFSGLATILFGISTDSLLIYSTLWFANGFAQGFGWPSCAKLLRHWFSPDQFGTFWSLLSSSVNISGSLSPFLAAFITLNFGWRTTLIAFGGVSIAMSLVGFFGLVNCPQDIGYPIINPNAAPKPKCKLFPTRISGFNLNFKYSKCLCEIRPKLEGSTGQSLYLDAFLLLHDGVCRQKCRMRLGPDVFD